MALGPTTPRRMNIMATLYTPALNRQRKPDDATRLRALCIGDDMDVDSTPTPARQFPTPHEHPHEHLFALSDARPSHARSNDLGEGF
ncbi:hypothetical protein PENSPDRAFT_692065 [Peniophora sp. CONT]|nr:hypothetical protein PENSPDRAFT_692065 [Peniophora sp. CONT]